MRTPISRVRSPTLLATTAYSPTDAISNPTSPKNPATLAALREEESPPTRPCSIVVMPNTGSTGSASATTRSACRSSTSPASVSETRRGPPGRSISRSPTARSSVPICCEIADWV